MTFDKNTELLLSKFAHELRNPLTSAYSAVQLIEMQHPEVQNFKYWSSIAEDLEYMNDLIGELSSFSKSERLNLSSFSSKAMMESVSLSFAASIANSDVEYTSKIPSSLPVIRGDEVKLKEVLRNLLRNAYEAALPDKTVYFEASVLENQLVFRIQDTGCGIAEEHLPTIFDPFITHKKNGTGLGLAICRHVIDAHRGSIQVESVLGQGTAFTISVPLAVCPDEAQPEM